MRLHPRQTNILVDRRAARKGMSQQVAALPIVIGDDGIVRVHLLTSRETKRWVIPKGWPMKGLKPHEAAAQEAVEEAGLSGKIGKKPIGRYTYFKRREAHFDACVVDVFLLRVEKQAKTWRERGQRQTKLFSLNEAIELVEETGLVAILKDLMRTDGSEHLATA